MDARYAAGRRHKPHLSFRLRCRARAAAGAYRRYRTHTQPPRVLDFGAAEGATMVEVHRLLGAAESIGVEYAADLIAAAEPLPADCRLLQGDVTAPLPEITLGHFDLVTALAVLEHLAEPAELIAQAHRALRPGGVFVATCPAGHWDRLSGRLRLHQDEHHETEFDRHRFAAVAEAGGLVPLRYERFMFAPLGFLPYLRIPVPVGLAEACDGCVRFLRVFEFTFVNQLFVARRP
ncbi:MAG TPA: class I SAM-dependent methyltransferase [Phycisphaerae bacterium]|jgi:SAM-dependent methyltransferase|nr:class I SAM-dependent methyltransferase [Phycisphaerae bacterium]HPC23637.1 class I SAM-dependent methyltransferase [Phycisphaerae bacterium]